MLYFQLDDQIIDEILSLEDEQLLRFGNRNSQTVSFQHSIFKPCRYWIFEKSAKIIYAVKKVPLF
jgi:hypothetical protein